jgi:hypothetical protein
MDTLIMQVNRYSNEVRYTLSLIAYHLSLTQPASVRIASHSIEMAQAVLRYLCDEPMSIFVETEEIQNAISDSLGRNTHVIRSGKDVADAAIFPFSLEDGLHPAGEKTIIAACYNALSYKTLLRPLSVKGNIFEKLGRLKPNYRLNPVAGLFAPRFILWLSLAKLVERWDSSLYFQLEDRAMRQFIEFGPMWRLSYIVVLTGRTAN